MAKFAVYTIPPSDSDMYRQGSEILGYDVRAGVMLHEDNSTRRHLPEFDPAWAALPQTYGFHATTGYSLYFDMATLPQIEQAMDDVFNCFSSGVEFLLTPAAERIPFWNGDIVVLHYDPNPAMLMLHTMLIARINPFGTGSNVSEAYAHKSPESLNPVNAHRVRQFYTPYMLDGWVPHFTLMMPYEGQQPEAMRAALLELFPPEPLRVESICLLVRDDEETHYRMYREFHLKNYPQPPIVSPSS
ncbi:MAG: DUF1045 domain-containing protein [Chloroflexi bacterium]|nr:DUF1045 domain-containing protein [Chloroflexota bacterium]